MSEEGERRSEAEPLAVSSITNPVCPRVIASRGNGLDGDTIEHCIKEHVESKDERKRFARREGCRGCPDYPKEWIDDDTKSARRTP